MFNRYRGRNRRGGGKRRFHQNHNGNRVAPKAIEKHTLLLNCTECGKAAPPYKCPTCLKKYCSVLCCNEHKKGCTSSSSGPSIPVTLPTNSASSSATSETVNNKNKRRAAYEFPTEDTVPLDKLMQLKDDERIHSLLKSARVRALITKLDESQNPPIVFRDIMKDPEFRAFSNTVLDIVGVKDDYNIPESTTDD